MNIFDKVVSWCLWGVYWICCALAGWEFAA